MRRIDLLGRSFGRLKVIECFGTIDGRIHWLCACECGEKRVVRSSALVSGNTKSCGCLNADSMAVVGRTNGTHRLSRTPEYHSWSAAINRCERDRGSHHVGL